MTVTPSPVLPALRVALRRLRRDERGINLVELITTMAILLIVITTLAGVFVSGSNAEVDLRHRYQAQSDGRLALDRFRREVHNACSATVTPSSVSLMTQNPTTLTCTVPSSWCAVLVSTGRYGLFRKAAATCDNTGTRWADYLISNAVFTSMPASAGTLPRVAIDITVDVKYGDTPRRYRLQDAIALRNHLRS